MRHGPWIKRSGATSDDIADPDGSVVLALKVTNAEREGIVPPSRGVSEGVVATAGARWQLERASVVDGVLDDLVVKER